MSTEQKIIENLSFEMLKTFLIVLVGIVALIIFGYKLVEIIRKEQDRKKKEKQLSKADISDQIARKVMEQLQPKLDEKFAEIDRKLAADKEIIEMHTGQLNAHEDRVKRLEEGNKALCHGIFALLNHEVTGNSIDKLKRAESAMKNYLIDGVYTEE